MALAIPEDDIQALYTFSLYPETVKDSIYSMLKESQLGDTPKKLAKKLSLDYDLDYQDVISVLNVYYSLARTINQTQITEEGVIVDLNNSIIEEGFDFDKEDLKAIEKTVLSFLSIKSDVPLITSIAYDQVSTNSNLYLNSKIVQDLRPVFFNEKLEGLTFYNTLRVHFESEDKTHHNVFLTMDIEDIDDLMDQLAEAKIRIQAIKEKFDNLIIQI